MPRRQPTAADFAAMAVAPLLIFVMLSSLASFLVLILDNGRYVQRLNWTVWMFTMGTVGIARITIERSRSYAFTYAGILGVAAFAVMNRFAGSPVVSVVLLGVIGYLADRIVHDCTIIDEQTDSSGRGLIDGGWTESGRAGESGARPPRGHQPGRSVLYLGAAVLPLFAVGQFLLRDDPVTASRARWMLLLILISGLSLLVVTAFLNLRRYVRQRGTDMGADVTVAWLAGGIAVVSLIVMLAYLAPLPGRLIASLELPESFTKTDDHSQQASPWGWGGESATKAEPGSAGSDQPQAEAPPEAEVAGERNEKGAPPGGTRGDNEDAPPGQDEGGKKPAEGEDQPGADDPSGKPEESDQKDQSDHSDKTGPPDPPQSQQSPQKPSPPSLESLGTIFKVIVFVVLVVVAALLFFLFRDSITAWWRSLFRSEPPLRSDRTSAADGSRSAAPPPRPFSSFRNPIGTADPKTVILETFQALEAWCREQGVSRSSDETPSEFVRRVASQFPNLAAPSTSIVDAYNRIVYGRGSAVQADLKAAVAVWERF